MHPKTGRVCVPIDPSKVRAFNPFLVPTLGQLARQIDEYDRNHGEEVTQSVDMMVHSHLIHITVGGATYVIFPLSIFSVRDTVYDPL